MVNFTNVLTDLATQAITAKLTQKTDSNQHKSSPYGSVGQLASNFFGGNKDQQKSPQVPSNPSYSQTSSSAYGNPDPYSTPSQYTQSNAYGSVDPYYSSPDPYQQQQQQMYNNNNNNSGYPVYPPNTQGQGQGQGYYGGGYPPAQPGYGNAPPYGNGSSSSLGFGSEPPYPGSQGGGSPYPSGGGGGAPYPGGGSGAPYPGGGGPGVGFNVGGGNSPYPPPSVGFSSPSSGAGPTTGVYPTHVMDSVHQIYGGNQPHSNPPYGQQQQQYGHQNPPQFQQQPHQPYNNHQQQPHQQHHQQQPQIMTSRPTLQPNPNFNANASAEMLRKAMKGFGCDKNKVVQALCSATNWQRQEIARAFKVMYGKELISDLKSELSGDFEDLVLALMEPPAQYDAHQLHDAMAGFGTKESVLIEIMTTRTNAQINAVKQAYRQMYHTELERDIIGDTSGHFQRLLVSLCSGGRDESCRVDSLKANQDARNLYRAGEQRLGTDESQFNAILASQNPYQLRAVFDEYQKVSGGHSIEQAIQSEFSGDLLNGLMAVVKCVRNRAGYFAELIYNSIKGLGTRDADLIRLIVSRAEIDLADIRDAYQRQYNTPLEKAIAGDCSGAYKEGLIALVKGRAI